MPVLLKCFAGLWYQGPKVTESCLIPFAQGYALNLQRISNLEVHPSAKAPEAIQPQAEQKREKEAESKEAKDKAKKQAKKQLVAMYDPGKRHDAMRTLELLMVRQPSSLFLSQASSVDFLPTRSCVWVYTFGRASLALLTSQPTASCVAATLLCLSERRRFQELSPPRNLSGPSRGQCTICGSAS